MAARAVFGRRAAWLTSPVLYHSPVKYHRAYSSASYDNRYKVEKLAKEIESIFERPDYLVEALGAYKRGEQGTQEATLLVVESNDDQVQSSPHATQEVSDRKAIGILSRLIAKGVLKQDEDTAKVTLAGDSTLFVNVHYASKPCHGSARLYLTGDDSYIRFLRVMAMEAGLLLTEAGLWKPLRARPTKQRSTSSTHSPLPAGFAIQSIDGEEKESEGNRRLREMRIEMGLPEGLDLSLDLGQDSQPQSKRQGPTIEDVEAALAEQLESKSDVFERILLKNESEHAILDVLGLVWLPPSLRTVKEPGSKT